jgi:hypothetical protein
MQPQFLSTLKENRILKVLANKKQNFSEYFYTTSSQIILERPVNPSLAHALKVVMEATVCPLPVIKSAPLPGLS